MSYHSRLVNLINCAGTAGRSNVNQLYTFEGSQKSSKNKVPLPNQNTYWAESCNGKAESSGYYDKYLWFGPRGNGGRFLY